MSPHILLDAFLWFIAALWFVEHVVSASRRSAPKRNRKLPAPSINCERTGTWRVNLPNLCRRQGD